MNINTNNLCLVLKHPAIVVCMENGIPIHIEDGEIRLLGFYKSDYVKLSMSAALQLEALDRYNEKSIIHSFTDLVYLNYEWWRLTNSRNNGEILPNSYWLASLLKYKYIEQVTKIMYKEIK